MSAPTNSDVLAVLANGPGPLSISEICARLGDSPSLTKVRAILRSLREAGSVEMTGQRRAAKYAPVLKPA